MLNIANTIATELTVNTNQVSAAMKLLDEGATVPFIARYRKEVTGGLDDTQLRSLESRLTYLRELEDRRQVILKTIRDQDKLSSELEQDILNAESKTLLEDLYLPYKPKRRTKGQIAIEAGLAPLADALWQNRELNPEATAREYVSNDKGIHSEKDALEGAKYILMERFAEDAKLLETIRRYLKKEAVLESTVMKGKEKEGAKYRDYFDYAEKISKIPSHRALALFRGRNESVLQLTLNADPNQEKPIQHSHCESLITDYFDLRLSSKPADKWLNQVIQWTWKVKIAMHLESELLSELRERAEQGAIKVFAENLKDLLMAAPAGPKATLGLDPGLRTGTKVAIVDATGKLVATTTIYPHAPQNQWDKSVRTIVNLVKQHKVELIAIGNGTASRETDKFAAEVIKASELDNISKIMVSEAGASVYSASELAALEFPELDVSLRGAVSIARRLQDPLAELVKIEPKAIGVGQYQHDVSQSALAKSLDAVVEDCVNNVGVDLNMASVPLLTRVSGLNKTLAQNIVNYRDEHGRFNNRKELKKVTRLGPKAFEQCAGFLRIAGGDNPLDASSVHPEAYPLVNAILTRTHNEVSALIGNSDLLNSVNASDYVDEQFGLPTINDILSELDKPGRDPRPEFKTASFKEGVETVSDLTPGMILEGVVSNVTNFGAFVDVGVHQDGLVHISSLTDKFVSDPRDVVKAGDIVKVKVMEVDVERKRISFTMRLDEQPQAANNKDNQRGTGKKQDGKPAHTQANKGKQNNASAKGKSKPAANAAMSDAFAAAFAKTKN
ncbi:Tex family protein [Flocculibacter collagenilyticus]|uniref:Tex family protein n=1 Tax=Flocculibacter collagenilyticus TaxID=2744479 RepID=UPI0018F7BB07|nr:Tex family protein [Flocculibacter collagenilyticus]